MSTTKSSGNRVAAVTGASGAIGKAIARRLAATPGYEVVLVCRDPEKAKRCVAEISATTDNANIRFEIADLSQQASITAMAKRWQGPLDVLVNNAAITPRGKMHTAQGVELQFATNVLGYFWMMETFTELLRNSADARIVNVASYWAGGLDLQDLEFENRPYHNDSAYRQSKQADRMLTVAFAHRLRSFGIQVTACHPGDVNSTLSNNLGFGGHQSPDEAAATPVWLAISESGGRHTGKYYEHQREVHCPFATDSAAVEALYGVCQSYSNPYARP
jgi:NAD(P)-dependent dehydrogenase (short-subunit alcohol dehydrogenase family)